MSAPKEHKGARGLVVSPCRECSSPHTPRCVNVVVNSISIMTSDYSMSPDLIPEIALPR